MVVRLQHGPQRRITIVDKADHRPPLKHNERIIHFQGPLGKSGDISIHEMPDGTMQIWLFKLALGTAVICPEGNRQPRTKAKVTS